MASEDAKGIGRTKNHDKNLDIFTIILEELGLGPWHYLFFATSLLVPASLPIFLVGSEFINQPSDFTCSIPEEGNFSPYNESECMMYDGSDLVSCRHWIYNTTRNTVTTEWNLVCGQAAVSPLFQSIYTTGCLLGATFAGIAANRYGRRWAVRVGGVGTVIGVVLLTTAPMFELVIAFRFLLGATTSLMVYPAFMLSMEVCIPRILPIVGTLLALPYAIMMMVLAGLAYFIQDWRTLQAVCSMPSFLILPVLYFVDESPRWLVVQNKIEEAVNILQRAATMNHVQLPDRRTLTEMLGSAYKKDLKKQRKNVQQFPESLEGITCSTMQHNYSNCSSCENCIESQTQPSTRLGLNDGFGPWWAGPVALVRTAAMRKLMIILIVIWVLQGVVYLGIPLSSDIFSSPYMYMLLLGVVELPAYILTGPTTRYFGRRTIIAFSQITCATLMFFLTILSFLGILTESMSLSMIFISYLLICASYQVNFLYAPELLPTTLRPWGTTVCTLSAYIGFSIPPFITDYLGDEMPLAPAIVFGSCSLVTGLFVFFLPETNGRPLPETTDDLQKK